MQLYKKHYYCIPLQQVFCFPPPPRVFGGDLNTILWSVHQRDSLICFLTDVCSLLSVEVQTHGVEFVTLFTKLCNNASLIESGKINFFIAVYKLFWHLLIVAVEFTFKCLVKNVRSALHASSPRGLYPLPPATGSNSFLRVLIGDLMTLRVFASCIWTNAFTGHWLGLNNSVCWSFLNL